MKIGVDASCWSNRRGFGRFTRELLTHVAAMDNGNEYWFFADQQTARTSRLPANVNIVSVDTRFAPSDAASASGRRSLPDLWKMTNAVARHDLQLFYFPAVYSFFPIRNRLKLAVTIHDMTPTRFPRAVFPNRKLQFFWKMKEKVALWQADRLITVSDHSKKEIIKHHHIQSTKVSVVSEGVSDEFRVFTENERRFDILADFQLNASDKFLLHTGGLSPHKNLRMLLKVFARLVRLPEFSEYKLLLVGDYDTDPFFSDFAVLQTMRNELNLQENVVFTGFVEDPALAQLYNFATLFVFPSLQEGFGLPAAESMACGAPIVASNAGSLPEVIGSAGEFFDPENEHMFLTVLLRVLQDPDLMQDMRTRGLERAKRFRWERSAKQLLDVFDTM